MSELNVPYSKPMILVIPKSVWKLGFPLEGRLLTSTQIHAYSHPPASDSDISLDDLEEIFRSSSSFELQIQHDFEHLDVPMVPVQLSALNVSPTGIELTFQITEITSSYDELLNELLDP